MQAAQDVTCDGAPALQLSRAGITALLKDRAPLMRGRGADAHKRLKIAPSAHAVVNVSSKMIHISALVLIYYSPCS
jgi:hypothetical protein